MKCIIVDDEAPSREELKYFVETFSDIEIAGMFSNAAKAIMFMKSEGKDVDVAFLDISMPRIDGMELAQIIKKSKSNLKLIFVTAYKEYAVEAFEIKAYDYLLKPFSKNRIIELLENLSRESKGTETSSEEIKNPEESFSKIAVWNNEKMIVLKKSDICYLEASERITLVYTQKNMYEINESLTKVEKKLGDNFFRSQRSFIVNLDKIIEIIPWFNSTYMLGLKNIKTQIPVSRNKIVEFRKLMNI